MTCQSKFLLVMAVAAICGGLAWPDGQLARAGGGAVVTLPLPKSKTPTRLRLDIDTRWVDGTGYRPVRVRVSPLLPGPSPADRKLQVTLSPRGWYAAASGSCTATVELPQGQRFAEATISVPQLEFWNSLDVTVSEGGRICRDLSANRVGIPVRNYYNWSEAAPSVLIVSEDAPPLTFSSTQRSLPRSNSGSNNVGPERMPDFRALAGRLPMSYWNGMVDERMFDISQATDDFQLLRLLNDLPRIEVLPPASLPDRWIDFTCVDVILLSFDQLQQLIASDPEKWKAIREWLATGPLLVVSGMGADYARLGELEQRMGLLPVEDEDAEFAGWREPSKRQMAPTIHRLNGQGQGGWFAIPNMAVVDAASGEEEQPPSPTPEKAEPSRPPLLVRDVDFGRLVALPGDDPFPGSPLLWSGLFNAVGDDCWMWYRRHGLSLQRENKDYWSLMIPGVGKAPVTSFLALISLFVIVIGPVNYFFLQRSNRLYLLLLTVPVGALLFTFGLVVYAATSDGLGVRSRTRSFTQIDQRQGQTVAWSRQSYYAGLAPSSGLSFPTDAAVYPIESAPTSARRASDSPRHLDWNSRQRLVEGYLMPRSTNQFLLVESRSTGAALDVDESSSPPRVTNRLGADIELLVLRGAAGDLFETKRVPAGESVTLVAADPIETKKHWDRLLTRHRPSYPQGFDPHRMDDFSDFFGDTYRYASSADDSLGAPTLTDSIPERRIRAILGTGFNGLAARSYLAHVVDSPEVSRGLDQLRSEADFHLLSGSW